MGNRNILQDFPSYILSKEAPDIDEILNNYDDLKKKVQVLQNITTGVFQYQGSRSLKVLVDDIKAYLANGGDNKYSKGCFYNINDLTGFNIKGLTVGDNIVFTGTIVTYSDEIPVSYNSQTGMGNICGFEFDRFPSVVDLSEYLKTADADAKYALISDLNNIVTEMENSIIQGGNIDSLTLDIPFTDTSRINKIYNVVRGNWNRVREEAGGYHRFNYNCTMTNVKIMNDNGSYYIQCNVSDIPTELYSRPLGNFTLNDGLSTFDIVIDSYIYTFEYTSYSGDPPSEVLKFSFKNAQYGPDFSDDYYAQKFVDNIYDLGDIATVWAVDINVGDNFVITKNGFDSMIGNYATSGELNDLQRKLDTINKTLSGVYKNGGDVSEMTLDVPVPSGKINTMYNVKSGFYPTSDYGEHGAFKYKITIKNAYILKTTSDSGNTYELCFKLGDIPSELWYYSIGMLTFYGKFMNTIDYQPTGTSGCFEFTSPSELLISITQDGLEQIIKLPYKTSYSAPTIDDYFSDKTFTDNKYQLGNITTIWYRNDISVDDNFVITEHGFDVLSYKVTDYVSKSSFDSLSATVAKKANSSDVYTKDEIRQKAFISETVSNYPVVIPKDEMLAGEQYTDFRIYGNADGFGTLSSSTNKYTINLTCRGKNLIYNLNYANVMGITVTKNDDGSVTLNGTATSNYQHARGQVSYLPPGTYHLSGCPQGGSEDTYYIKIGTLGVDTGDGVTFTLDTAGSVIPIINVKKGTTLDNVTFKPQIEIGEVATGFEKWGQKSDITITLDTALGENEYVDVINKKRYNGDGTVSNVTVSGEMSVFDSDMNVIYCPMTTSPSKIEMSYYKDINNVIAEINPEIKDGSVTTAKIADGAVTTDKIGSDLGQLIESKLSKAQASEAFDLKANVADVYTKTETDEKTADKRKAIPHTTASGYPLTVTDHLEGESVINYQVYGNSIQDGTPTPETPIEIQSVGDLVTDETSEYYGKYDVPVVTKGKNLLDYTKATASSGGNISFFENGFTFTGKFYVSFNCDNIVVGNVYVMSWNYQSNDVLTPKWRLSYTDGTFSNTLSNGGAITIDKKVKNILIYPEMTSTIHTTTFTNIQLEKGSSVTEYEPYSGETKHIYLDEPLRKVGDYADYVDFENQKVVRNINYKAFTGNDGWQFERQGEGYISCYTLFSAKQIGTTNILSNTFNVGASSIDINTIYGRASNKSVSLCLSTEYATTLAEFKAFITERYNTGAPIICYYQLEIPSEETITVPELSAPTSEVMNVSLGAATSPSQIDLTYYQDINNIIGEVSGLADTGKYDTIIDYTYTGDEAATELNILLTVEQLRKIKKYEKFLCYVKYNVSATTGTTSFWATATLILCTKGTTTPIGYAGMFMRAANTVQKITADNTPITWIATTEKVRLPNSDVCITNVLDYGGTQYNMFNMSTLLGGSSRTSNYTLYKNSETAYDWVMQLKSPTAMPFVNGMKFIMWGK